MDLLIALKEGRVAGINEKPTTHIETVMSHVLIYDDVVRKIYKNDREGVFLNLKNPVVRKNFYRDDFDWNQDVSPDIHKNLYGAKKDEHGNYTIVPFEDTDDWFIEMKRIESEDTLFKRLHDETVTLPMVRQLAEIQTKRLNQLTEKWLEHYNDLSSIGLPELWRKRLDEDLRNFGYSFGADIPTTTTDARVDKLLQFFATHPYFSTLSVEDAEIAIDNHAGNIVFVDDTPQFIDIYLLKREWRLIDRHHNIARIATCVRVLGGDELASEMYATFASYHSLAPSEVYRFMEAYNALIKGYYYTYLQKPETAARYFTFADATLETL